MDKPKKQWYKRTWAIILYVIIGLIIIANLLPESETKDVKEQSESAVKEVASKDANILEMTTEQIFNEFGGLSDIQKEEKLKEFKGKRIKTSIYVSKIDKASLSSQYVAMEMYDYPYNLLPYVKAFFPASEKDSLLKANIGDTIIFSGEFVNYNKGGLTSYIEFTKSKLIEIKKKE